MSGAVTVFMSGAVTVSMSGAVTVLCREQMFNLAFSFFCLKLGRSVHYGTPQGV